MTHATHRDLYATSFAERVTGTLKRLNAAKSVVEQRFPNLTLPVVTPDADVTDVHFQQRQQAWDVRMASTLRLRALVDLAMAGGKDPITVTIDDMVLLVSTQDMLDAFDAALANTKPSTVA